VVDQLQIFAAQRYSVVLEANQPVDNYWIRALPSTANATYDGGLNTAILRYVGASEVDPTTVNTTAENPLVETNLHTLNSSGAAGTPGYGNADINLSFNASFNGSLFAVNDVSFVNPTVPVLLQILSGAQDASELLPNGSVYILEANKVVELTVSIVSAPGGPHPIHLHGHTFDVVQSADSSTFNYVNPVRRDVVSAGIIGQQTVIRWTTDNSGPWILHCHIDWHLAGGFAVVMAESPADTSAHVDPVPSEWDRLCPLYNQDPDPTVARITDTSYA